MIILDLACDQDHPFEGWFQSLSAYQSQHDDGMINCPNCGSAEIHRVPSAVHLSKNAETPPREKEGGQAHSNPGEIQAAFQQLMSAILSNSEDVGKDFADEARRIHYLEAPERAIRGEATVSDYESLREEGIDVMLIPSLKKEDLN